MSASPESFSSTRLKAASRDSVGGGAVTDNFSSGGPLAAERETRRSASAGPARSVSSIRQASAWRTACQPGGGALAPADGVRRKPRDLHVLAGLARERGAHLLDLQLLVADVRLLEQDDLLEPLAQPA